jgi:DNA-binding transcriptional ArsR family regulator
MKTHYIKNLEQARLLTDPFKLKLLEQFAHQARTTKQVADRLGEKAPKLYRHVDALAEAGLLELVEEKPKRGTVERYYRTVATRFEVQPQTITSGRKDQNEAVFLIEKIFSDTRKDLVRLTEAEAQNQDEKHKQPLIAKLSISASEKDLGRLQKKLEEWMEECNTLAARKSAKNPVNKDEEVHASALLAFYRKES